MKHLIQHIEIQLKDNHLVFLNYILIMVYLNLNYIKEIVHYFQEIQLNFLQLFQIINYF